MSEAGAGRFQSDVENQLVPRQIIQFLAIFLWKRVLLFGTLISDVTLGRPEKMDETCAGDAGLIAVRCISGEVLYEIPAIRRRAELFHTLPLDNLLVRPPLGSFGLPCSNHT